MDTPCKLPQWSLSTDYPVGSYNWIRCLPPEVVREPATKGGIQVALGHPMRQLITSRVARFLALKSFASHQRSTTILLHLDNVTAIELLFSTTWGAQSLSSLALEICIKRKIIIYAEHLSGWINVRVDWESRSIPLIRCFIRRFFSSWPVPFSILLSKGSFQQSSTSSEMFVYLGCGCCSKLHQEFTRKQRTVFSDFIAQAGYADGIV